MNVSPCTFSYLATSITFSPSSVKVVERQLFLILENEEILFGTKNGVLGRQVVQCVRV